MQSGLQSAVQSGSTMQQGPASELTQAMDPQAMADGVHHQAYDGGLAMQVLSEESEPPESQQPYSPLNIHDLLPIEAARVRFLHLIIDHFVTYHIVPISEESQLAASHSPGERRKRRAREMEDGQPPVEQQVIRPSYEGDPRHLLPLIFLANAYETLVGEVNQRMAEMDVLRGKTMGLALEAAGGLYRRMVEKFPKSGAVTIFRRREMASALEARARFPQLVLGRDDKRVRFIVVHGLELVERPSTMSPDDAEWFKRITGRHEVAIYPRDFKYFTPRPKPRRVPQPSVSAVTVANPAELPAPMHHMVRTDGGRGRWWGGVAGRGEAGLGKELVGASAVCVGCDCGKPGRAPCSRAPHGYGHGGLIPASPIGPIHAATDAAGNVNDSL
ncbi:unnamed protein product [Closterium sp. Yama58-4]|nr:unnamed protein product [Closterium sp. Yama58-4]